MRHVGTSLRPHDWFAAGPGLELKPLIVESDDWRAGPHLASVDVQERVRAALESGVLIIEHWHYRGSSAPTRLFVEDPEEWEVFLSRVVPGDKVYVWEHAQLCRRDNALVAAKAPDSQGRTPQNGAY